MVNNQNIVGDVGYASIDSKSDLHQDNPNAKPRRLPKNKVAALRTNKTFLPGSYGLDPNLQCAAQHALYEPITERFIFCGANYKIMQQLLVAFSSRYPMLRLIRLDLAENFTPTLISNYNITSWSFKGMTGLGGDKAKGITIHSAEMSILSGLLLPAKLLVECDADLVKDEAYVQDMEYMQKIYSLYESIQSALANMPLGEFANVIDVNLPFYATARQVPFNTNDDNSSHTADLHKFLIEMTNIVYTEFDYSVAWPMILELKGTFK